MRADQAWLTRKWEDMKAVRLQREPEWQQIADYFLPTKNFNVETIKGQGVPRKVMTSTPQRALAKFSAMLVGYLVDPTRPFLKPNVAQGLITAGRAAVVDKDAADYLDNLAWQVFDRFMLAKSGGMGALSRMALELGAFGTAVVWVGHKRGFGPRYLTRPLRACWIDIDDDDQVDTLFYEFSLCLEDVFARWPETAAKCPDLLRLYNDPNKAKHGQKIKILHCVYPRKGGEAGGLAGNKPVAEVMYAHEFKDSALAEGGYDSFPYAVPRLRVAEGNPYGQGPAWQSLPAAIAYNRLRDLIEYGIGQRVAPPIFAKSRLFKKPSRELGYINYIDPKALGFDRLSDLIQAWPVSGDPTIGAQYLDALKSEIDEPFNIDWMALREAGNVTAEEIKYRKRMNMTGQTGMLTSVDRDLMGVIGDRTLDVMGAEGMIAPPPASLSQVEVNWDFAGPLAMAQQQNQVDAVEQLIQIATQAAAVDPDAPAILVLSEGLRIVAEASGAPPTLLRSRTEFDQIVAQRAQERQDAQQAQTAAMGAQALRDAGQGAQTLTAVNGAQRRAA